MTMRLSIITPSFNQGRYIERTIQSVLSQDFRNTEYVVMDGGSTDETLSILKKYEPRLRWVSEKDKGQAHAVNKGICATSGEIIGWLNSDDIYYPGAVLETLSFFTTHPEVDVLYGDAHHIDKNDRLIEPYPTEAWNLDRLKETCFISQPAVFFRRRVVERFGLLDETLNYCMDYEFWLRLAYRGIKFAYLPKTVAATRLYSETKTLGARVQVHREINDMMRTKFGKVPDRWLFNYAHIRLEKMGLNRSNRWLFIPVLIAMTSYYALRWNRNISLSMASSMWKWLIHACRQLFNQVPAS